MNFYKLMLIFFLSLPYFNVGTANSTPGCLVGPLNICLNGGTCNSLTGNCDCLNGFTGLTCNTFIGCLATGRQYVCQNGGKCLNDNAVGNCACSGGYTGQYCQIPLGCNAGGTSNCVNGGVCVSLSGTCTCPQGYNGFTCSLIDPCSSSPCLNAGLCTAGVGNSAVCTCLSAYYGPTCSSYSACLNSPCRNGGTCINQSTFSKGYSCACPTGFYGANCTFSLNNVCSATDSNYSLCSFWSSSGLCDYQYLYDLIPVPIYCPTSCKLCNQILNCQDSQASCIFWAASNMCSLVNRVNKNLCRKSCNTC